MLQVAAERLTTWHVFAHIHTCSRVSTRFEQFYEGGSGLGRCRTEQCHCPAAMPMGQKRGTMLHCSCIRHHKRTLYNCTLWCHYDAQIHGRLMFLFYCGSLFLQERFTLIKEFLRGDIHAQDLGHISPAFQGTFSQCCLQAAHNIMCSYEAKMVGLCPRCTSFSQVHTLTAILSPCMLLVSALFHSDSTLFLTQRCTVSLQASWFTA